MARSIVQTDMINRTAYRDLQDAGMDAPQAEAVAAHLPDWSQFATKQDLATLQSEMRGEMATLRGEMKDLQATLIRWMVGLFLTFTAVLGCPADIEQPAGLTGRNGCAACPGWVRSWTSCSSQRAVRNRAVSTDARWPCWPAWPPEPRPVLHLAQSCLRVHDSLYGHVTATRHSPAVHAFHVRLCRRGKPRKVTLIAAMRKLLLILNTVPRDQIPWQPNCVPTAGED